MRHAETRNDHIVAARSLNQACTKPGTGYLQPPVAAFLLSSHQVLLIRWLTDTFFASGRAYYTVVVSIGSRQDPIAPSLLIFVSFQGTSRRTLDGLEVRGCASRRSSDLLTCFVELWVKVASLSDSWLGAVMSAFFSSLSAASSLFHSSSAPSACACAHRDSRSALHQHLRKQGERLHACAPQTVRARHRACSAPRALG
jgi:hypothetical protein